MRLLLAVLLTAAALSAQTLEQAESLWKQHRYFEANDAFRALVNGHPRNAEYRVRWGRLFLERFQPADAAQLFQEALKIDANNAGAFLGLALVAAEDFESQAVDLARKALAADPHLLEAQELLGRLALEDNDPKKAAAEAHRALEMSPASVQAKAILATIDWLNDKPETPWDTHAGEAYENPYLSPVYVAVKIENICFNGSRF